MYMSKNMSKNIPLHSPAGIVIRRVCWFVGSFVTFVEI